MGKEAERRWGCFISASLFHLFSDDSLEGEKNKAGHGLPKAEPAILAMGIEAQRLRR